MTSKVLSDQSDNNYLILRSKERSRVLDRDHRDDEIESNEPIRPIGRNRVKHSTLTSTGTGSKEQSVTTLLDKLSKINTKNDRFLSYREKQLKVQVAERMEKKL